VLNLGSLRGEDGQLNKREANKNETNINAIIIFYPMFVFDISGNYSLVESISPIYDSKAIERTLVLSVNLEFGEVKLKQKTKNMPKK